MGIVFSDFGRAKLASGITAGTTAPFTMNLDDGTKFKAYGAGEYEYLVLKDASLNREIIKVTARTGNAFTVSQRAIGVTTARDWSIGDLCEAALTAEGLAALLDNTLLTGTTTATQLNVGGVIGGSAAGIQNVQSAPGISFGLPTIPASVIAIGTMAGFGYTSGTTWQPGAGLTLQTTEIWSSTASGARVVISTTPNGSLSLRESFSFDQDGGITLPVLGARIRGDFSNTTLALGVAFQTSTADGRTFVSAIPNGTSQNSSFISYNASNFTNAGRIGISIDGNFAYLFSSSIGSGTALPLNVLVGAATAARFGTAGQWGIGGANYGTAGQAIVSGGASAAPAWTTIDKTFIGLGAVENTALSTWAGSGNITTLGTITGGTVPVARVSGLAAVATSGSKADVGLPLVDNVSDANKPVSTAQAAADVAVANAAASDATTKATAAYAAAVAASQPLDADLTAIAALSTTAFGRALLTKINGADVRAYVGVGAWINTGITPGVTVDVSNATIFPDGIYLIEIAGFSHPLHIRRGAGSESTSAIFSGVANLVGHYISQYDGSNTISGVLRQVDVSTGTVTNPTATIDSIYRWG